MRFLIALFLVISPVACFDSVLFSKSLKLSADYPTVAALVTRASSESPVVFIVNPDFTLGQFSKQVSAFSTEDSKSSIAQLVKTSENHVSRHLDESIHVPKAELVTDLKDFKTGEAIYIVSGEEWTSMEQLAVEVAAKLPADFVGIITATDAVTKDKTRVKRVSTDEMSESDSGASRADATAQKMPLVIPPYNVTDLKFTAGSSVGSCLLYSEGVNIVVWSVKANEFANIPVRMNNTQWSYADGDVACVSNSNFTGSYSFRVNYQLTSDVVGQYSNNDAVKMASGATISFKLDIVGDSAGYWSLRSVTVMEDLTVSGVGSFISGSPKVAANSNSSAVSNVGMISVVGWAFNCGNSEAVFFNTDNDDVRVGISLYNTEIQPYGAADTKGVAFTLNVDDCTGTFSPGSWMGIISILVLLSGFIFGYLMLNSVETMDRFDDPKQKQIVINVRE